MAIVPAPRTSAHVCESSPTVTIQHMGGLGALLPSIAVVEAGDASGPHLTTWDWAQRRSPVSLCGQPVTGVARRGYERGCAECASVAVGVGVLAVQGHDGVIVNLDRCRVPTPGAEDQGDATP